MKTMTCSYCGARITPNQEKTTIALFSKPVCSKNECTRKAQDEANMQTETLMTPRAKVLALLARRGFVEQSVPGFFVLDGDTQIAIDLNHQVTFPGIPVIGVLQTNGDIIEEGHGINRINDIRQEIEGILKSKSKRQVERERSVGQERSKVANELNSHAILKNSVTPPDESQSSSTEQPAEATRHCNETKLGTPDTLTRGVKDDSRQTISEQEDKNILSATPAKDQKTEVKGGQESPQPKVKVTIKICFVCGMELSGARALECFQKDKPFICETCEEKKELKKMEQKPEKVSESLPTPISSTAIVRPAVSPQEAIAAWKEFNDLKKAIITDADKQKIGDRDFIKKSGWRKLATFFNLTDKITEEIQFPHQDGGWTWKIKVTAIAPNGRISEGVGICSTSERKFAHIEHDTYATAHTRAKNRAISDMIAGGEVSAEEID